MWCGFVVPENMVVLYRQNSSFGCLFSHENLEVVKTKIVLSELS